MALNYTAGTSLYRYFFAWTVSAPFYCHAATADFVVLYLFVWISETQIIGLNGTVADLLYGENGSRYLADFFNLRVV